MLPTTMEVGATPRRVAPCKVDYQGFIPPQLIRYEPGLLLLSDEELKNQ